MFITLPNDGEIFVSLTKSKLEEEISDSHYKINSEYERSSKIYMRAMVPTDRPLRILDVGCGTGLNAKNLTKLGHTVVGIDLSPVAIEEFRAKGFEGSVVDIESGPLPFEPNSFDLVYASEVIEHCIDTEGFLDAMHRVLKPDGILMLSTPNSSFWAYRLLGLLGKAPSEYQHPGHVRFFSVRGLVKSINSCGFNVISASARHMYLIIGRRLGDPLAPFLKLVGMKKEPRFITKDHFWQMSSFARKANGFWADTIIISASKKIS